MKPLEGLLVLEFAQFMAGPSAGLRLADLGARVIKIERPVKGEAGRNIALKNLFLDGSSLVFHTANRNKESFAANLKDSEDLDYVKKLIKIADVVTHNFRPGVMDKLGLDYKSVSLLNPRIIYASVTGYGTDGPWKSKPGQDLLIQCLSGLAWLTGNKDDGPIAVGAAVSDLITGTHLVQGILAGLIRRNTIKKGACIEVSLLESTLDLQFEVITTYLNGDNKLPVRASEGSAHAFLGAPYGIYKSLDGHLAIAMGSLIRLFQVLNYTDLDEFNAPDSDFYDRDKIMSILNSILGEKKTHEWIEILQSNGIWCSEVLNYEQLLDHDAFKVLEMQQELTLLSGDKVHTTRCPIRINEEISRSTVPAPRVGQHTEDIIREFNL